MFGTAQKLGRGGARVRNFRGQVPLPRFLRLWLDLLTAGFWCERIRFKRSRQLAEGDDVPLWAASPAR